MKKSKSDEKIEKIIEKAYPLASKYLESFYQPIIEIVKLTLPISTGILIASFTLDMKVLNIVLFGLNINSILVVVGVQLIILYLFLINKQNNVNKLQREVLQMYLLPLEKHLKTKKEEIDSVNKKVANDVSKLQEDLNSFNRKFKETSSKLQSEFNVMKRVNNK